METKEKSYFFPKVAVGVIVLFLLSSSIFPQSCYSPDIDSIISKVSLQSFSKYCRVLSGDTSAIIGGVPYTIISRYWEDEGNQKAAQYIYERFQNIGYQPVYDTFRITGINVLAKKTGVKYPNQYFIICAHFDDGPLYPPPSDTIPGADDNASGVSAVLEAARILFPYDLDYSIVFAAWDEEEIGLRGSKAFADSAFAHGDSIVAVLNLDMIAWDGNNDWLVRIGTDTNSVFHANVLQGIIGIYAPALVVVVWGGGWDESSFWNRGYKGILFTEDNNYFNPNYHMVTDKFPTLNLPYFLKTMQITTAFLFAEANNYLISFNHVPLQSNFDTASRITSVTISSNRRIGIVDINNNPRLYYKVGNSTFGYLQAFYHNLDTFKFLIPGQTPGSSVSYYIAAQDSLGTMVGSLPAGARGINPPGTMPPPKLFTYRILKQSDFCSDTLPKAIPPMQLTLDTIHISQGGNIYDYDLNLTVYHSTDSLLYIWLTRPGATLVQLSMANGGSGQNYFNTTFDDEASIPITEGVAPFIGSYRPETPLSTFDSRPMQGDWILRIFNYSETITGQLSSWCLSFEHYDPIGIVNNQIPVKISLSQNYPNPFNSSTKINFTLLKQSHVRISVYDVLGREVKVLVNNLLNYGEHNLSFEANNLASGLYFYSMYIDGDLFVTKKMVLIK
jgi:hypothetical protein